MPDRRRKNGPRGGIDLGGTKIQAAVIDAEGKSLGDARRPTPTTGGPADVAREMAAAMVDAASAAGMQTDSLAGIGVGSPGDVNTASGEVSGAGNLPGWEGTFELAATLTEALGAPVRLGNDVNVATLAEARLGAGRPYDSLLGVFWGTGVGGGVILDGQLWLGRGAAGEIGHVVVRRGGARCPCGRRGCMEAYAGRAAMEAKARRDYADGAQTDLFKLMEKHGRDRLTSSIWARALDRSDRMATELVDRAVKAIAAAIGSAANLLDVEAVVIGGGLGVRFGEPYVERIRQHAIKHIFNDSNPPDILLAGLGDLGGAIGASLLVDPEARTRELNEKSAA